MICLFDFIFNIEFSIPFPASDSSHSPELRDLICNLLRRSPIERPNIEKILHFVEIMNSKYQFNVHHHNDNATAPLFASKNSPSVIVKSPVVLPGGMEDTKKNEKMVVNSKNVTLRPPDNKENSQKSPTKHQLLLLPKTKESEKEISPNNVQNNENRAVEPPGKRKNENVENSMKIPRISAPQSGNIFEISTQGISFFMFALLLLFKVRNFFVEFL